MDLHKYTETNKLDRVIESFYNDKNISLDINTIPDDSTILIQISK